MVFHENKVTILSGFGAKTYSWKDLITPGKMAALESPMMITSVFRQGLYWWKDDFFVRNHTRDTERQDRVEVYDRAGELRSFGKLPEGYRDANLNRNEHLSSIGAIDNDASLFYIAYEYADLIEVYSLETGEKLGQARNIEYQFPPDHKVSLDGVAYPESDYFYFQTIKAYGGKLYALHRYKIPTYPKKSHPKMKMLVFDGKTLELEEIYELDEDWVDFIVFDQQVLGLCYYCDYPIRRYSLDD
jgi:hypothetical protein